MKRIELNTTRLILKELSQNIYDYAFKELQVEESIMFLGLNSNQDYFSEKEKYNLGLSTYNKKFLTFQLQYKESMEIIGWCGYHTWYIEHQRAEIGYALNDNRLKGKGLMFEAIEKVIEYGFSEMNLNRIEAFIGPDNVPSLKLIEKMNFKKEGQLRQHYFKNNQLEDSLVFSLLKDDFKKSPGQSR